MLARFAFSRTASGMDDVCTAGGVYASPNVGGGVPALGPPRVAPPDWRVAPRGRRGRADAHALWLLLPGRLPPSGGWSCTAVQARDVEDAGLLGGRDGPRGGRPGRPRARRVETDHVRLPRAERAAVGGCRLRPAHGAGSRSPPRTGRVANAKRSSVSGFRSVSERASRSVCRDRQLFEPHLEVIRPCRIFGSCTFCG